MGGRADDVGQRADDEDEDEAAEPANGGKGKADDQNAYALTNLLKAAKIKSKAEASDSQTATYAGYYGGANQIKAGKGGKKADDQQAAAYRGYGGYGGAKVNRAGQRADDEDEDEAAKSANAASRNKKNKKTKKADDKAGYGR